MIELPDKTSEQIIDNTVAWLVDQVWQFLQRDNPT